MISQSTAVVGRQVWSGIARLAAYRAAGDRRLKAVIIDLGTNGPISPADVSRFRALAAGVPLLVFLLTCAAPFSWQAESDASLAAVAGQPGVVVVDWYSASANPAILWPDGIPPRPQRPGHLRQPRGPGVGGLSTRNAALPGAPTPRALPRTSTTIVRTMASILALLVATNNAPADWVWGSVASVVFVALIAWPAAVLNARDHGRRQKEQAGTEH